MRNKQRSYSFSNWDSNSNQRIYYQYDPKVQDHNNNQQTQHYVSSHQSFGPSRNTRGGNLRGDIKVSSQFRDNSPFFQPQAEHCFGDRQPQSKEAPTFGNYFTHMENKIQSFEKWQKSSQYLATFESRCKKIKTENQIQVGYDNWKYRNSCHTVSQLHKMNEDKLYNIDRINSKIKKILETLNQEEQKINTGDSYIQNRAGFNNRKILPSSKHQRTKTEGKLRQLYEHIPGRDNSRQSDLQSFSQSKKERQNKNIYEKLLNIKDKYRYSKGSIKIQSNFKHPLNEISANQAIKPQFKQIYNIPEVRVLTCGDETTYSKPNNHQLELRNTFSNKLGDNTFNTPTKGDLSISKYGLRDFSVQSLKLGSGKDLNVQIGKIQQRINNISEMKKTMGETSAEKQIKYSRKNNLQKISKQNQNISSFKTQQNVSYRSSLPSAKINYERPQNFSKSSAHQLDHISLPKPFKLVMRRAKFMEENSQVKFIESALISQERGSRDYFNIPNSHSQIFEVSQYSMNKTEKIQEVKGQKEKVSENFLRSLCEQIELDSNFRNAKKWFTRLESRNLRRDKWEQLSEELLGKSIRTTYKQNRELFNLSEEEDNPFLTLRQGDGSYTQLIESFLGCEKSWLEKLKGKFREEEIQIAMKRMDIDRKGYVCLEDLVRFVNIECDQYYRNRDLILIFKRLSGREEKMSSQSLKKQLCKKGV